MLVDGLVWCGLGGPPSFMREPSEEDAKLAEQAKQYGLLVEQMKCFNFMAFSNCAVL